MQTSSTQTQSPLSFPFQKTLDAKPAPSVMNEAEFADALKALELGYDAQLLRTVCDTFTREMERARLGRICTPERMAKLYPIFREINEEMERIEAEWDALETEQVRG
jgi:hypothetical protein